MSKKNEDVKAAIDAIFGDDFIEIDKTNEESSDNTLTFTDLEEDEENEVNNKVIEDNNIIENINKINDSDYNEDIKDEIEPNSDYYNESPILLTKPSFKDKIIRNIKNININKNNILYTLGVAGIVLLVILLIITIIIVIFGVKKDVKCVSNATDNGYSFKEIYEITHKKNEIIKIKSLYRYEATSSEYMEQVQFVKNDKIPVVINSNGMKGFTYIIEEKDDMFEVTGYLDFREMDFAEIDKVDKKLFPVSYIEFDSKTTYESLEKMLKKKGFTCSIVK